MRPGPVNITTHHANRDPEPALSPLSHDPVPAHSPPPRGSNLTLPERKSALRHELKPFGCHKLIVVGGYAHAAMTAACLGPSHPRPAATNFELVRQGHAHIVLPHCPATQVEGLTYVIMAHVHFVLPHCTATHPGGGLDVRHHGSCGYVDVLCQQLHAHHGHVFQVPGVCGYYVL